jgi:hypothetical protein
LGKINNYAQARHALENAKKRWLAVNPTLNDHSGIYILTREENGFRYAYAGQAKAILTRLSQHLLGYQHIDISLKKRGLYTEDNPHGWKVHFEECPIAALDEAEKVWIKYMADHGFQLYNHTTGSQGEGKAGLGEGKSTKGYRDGLAQGRKNLARELKHIVDTHLEVRVRKDNKVTQKALEKFWTLLTEDNDNGIEN